MSPSTLSDKDIGIGWRDSQVGRESSEPQNDLYSQIKSPKPPLPS